MKRMVLAPALAIGLSGLICSPAHSQDQRHFESGIFTLSVGDAVDLTEEHLPLEFIKVWPHPFGDRAINIMVGEHSFSVAIGSRINLKSSFTRTQIGRDASFLSGKDYCAISVIDFDNPTDGAAQVTLRLDCG
jgi:hypothetical protein